MFIVYLLTAKYISHRFGPHRASFFVGLAVVLVLGVELGVSIRLQSAVLTNKDISRNILAFGVAFSIAAVIGVRWARKTQEGFLISCAFDRLAPSDRQALSELVKSLADAPDALRRRPNKGIQADAQEDARG